MTDDAESSVPPAPCPGTPQEWRAYLAEYSEWYLSSLDEDEPGEVTQEQLDARWLGHDPADERTIAAAEERLGVALPPSLRAFLLTSDGWGRVAEWIDALRPCAEFGWFRDEHTGWVSEDGGEEEDVFRYGLQITRGEDVFLLDTSDVLENGEYRAYLLAVKYGELSDPCDSFSELLTVGREEIQELMD
ncbi:SMI1/KNR4 family protein [Streptomyces xiamenensis]|uniref:SMI1/KNR4 family protein n=1 Tax=Streptomyces xiamenensis TaxID=408015 RepID=UPI0036CB35F5